MRTTTPVMHTLYWVAIGLCIIQIALPLIGK